MSTVRPVKHVACRQRYRGAALVEWLVGVPVVLMIGLLCVQWALVWQARHAAEYAALMAARSAATHKGDASALESGLAEGLGPWWGLALGPERVQRLNEGLQAGWLSWERVWPPPTVFEDFAQPALDAYGRIVRGERELPNDNLRFRSDAAGARSGVNVQEANRIAVQLTIGVPLHVPLASSLIVRTMQMVDKCSSTRRLQLVVTDFAMPEAAENPRAWTCRMYRAPDRLGGDFGWRLPVRVVASVRMHSPLRASAKTRNASTGSLPPPPGRRLPGDHRLSAPERDRPGSGRRGGIVDDMLPDDGHSENPNAPIGFEPPEQDDDSCESA